MKISRALELLGEIQGKFGDLEIVGGWIRDDTPLAEIMVVNKEGAEIWPNDPNGMGQGDVEGVFLTS